MLPRFRHYRTKWLIRATLLATHENISGSAWERAYSQIKVTCDDKSKSRH